MSQDDSAPDFDLFGEPMLPRRERRGRPAHRFSSEFAENIAVLSAAGMTQAEISGLVGLSEKTLRKYYSASLDRGHELALGATMISAFKAMRAGKGWAHNLMIRRLEGDAPAPLSRAPSQAKPAAEGKKAAANARAQTAHEGTEWAGLIN